MDAECEEAERQCAHTVKQHSGKDGTTDSFRKNERCCIGASCRGHCTRLCRPSCLGGYRDGEHLESSPCALVCSCVSISSSSQRRRVHEYVFLYFVFLRWRSTINCFVELPADTVYTARLNAFEVRPSYNPVPDTTGAAICQ